MKKLSPYEEMMAGSDEPQWWPKHVQTVFSAIGHAMGDKRLNPDLLRSLSGEVFNILPGHHVVVRHEAKTATQSKRGRYVVTIQGPAFAGQWTFASGKLEKLARSAAIPR